MVESRCKMGVDGCWCAPWSSKPVIGVKSLLGGFDSHIFPPDPGSAHTLPGLSVFGRLLPGRPGTDRPPCQQNGGGYQST